MLSRLSVLAILLYQSCAPAEATLGAQYFIKFDVSYAFQQFNCSDDPWFDVPLDQTSAREQVILGRRHEVKLSGPDGSGRWIPEHRVIETIVSPSARNPRLIGYYSSAGNCYALL